MQAEDIIFFNTHPVRVIIIRRASEPGWNSRPLICRVGWDNGLYILVFSSATCILSLALPRFLGCIL